MNPGVLEEAGKFANSITIALGSQPMTLAMILSNIALLVFLFYSETMFYNQRQELSKLWLEDNAAARELISRCVVPERR